MTEQKKIILHEWQVKAWQAQKRFIFFCAGVQSGKTTFGSVWIINESERRGAGDYLVVAPTYKILNQSTLQKFKELIPRGWGVFNKADSTFITKDGRTFFLRSADKPESIEGITAQAIWADEASLMKADAWLMMQGRVSRTLGRILCTFTPIALNWIHKELEKDKERIRKGLEGDIDFIQFRSVDSPYFPKEEFERAKRMLTATQFRLRYEGIFGKAEGLIYPDFDNRHIVEDFKVPADWTRIGGMDFGFNNPFVALDGAVSPDDVLYIYKERYRNRCLLKEHVPFLNTAVSYFADPSGLQERRELRAFDMDIVPGNNDVALGIQKVTARIKPLTDDDRTIRLKVFKSCINTIDEFALYRYKEGQDKEILKEEPEKKDDHAMDALRYLVIGLDGIGAVMGVHVLGDMDSSEEGVFKSAAGDDDWEQRVAEMRKRKQKEGGEKDDLQIKIMELRKPEIARKCLVLLQEGKQIDEIAKELGVDTSLFRQFWQVHREYILDAGKGGGIDSGKRKIEVV